MFNNPIILRELIVQLRKKQSFFYLFLFLAVGSITFLFWWYELILSYAYNPGYVFSRNLFMSLSFLEGITLLLFAPLLTATAINLEKERDTWDLLITSPINQTSVLLGKFLSPLLFVCLVLISILPIFSLTMPVGGVSPWELLSIFAMFTEETIIASMIGLFCSIRWKRTIQSISMTYAFCFIYFLAIPIAPEFFTHNPSALTLISPLILVLYYIRPPGTLGNLLQLTDLQVIGAHYALFAGVFLVLFGLCIWQIRPAGKQRSRESYRREAIAIERWLTLGYVLLLMTPLTQFLYNPITLQTFLDGISEDFGSSFFISFLFLLFCVFPLLFTVRYQLLWDRESWPEDASTPKQLRRFLLQNLKRPFSLYLMWIAFTSPYILYSSFIRPITIPQSIWAFFFLGETVCLIAAIILLCSLMTRGVFQSLVYSYLLLFIVFVFIPALGKPFGQPYFSVTSPISNLWLPFTKSSWMNPFIPLWGMYIASFCVHFLFMLLYIGIPLILCEWRMSVISGQFERESFWKWLRRNLRNQSPRARSDPREHKNAFFPDRRNPIKERERRDFTIYHRTFFVKSLSGLLLTSAALFLFLPVIHSKYYMDFIAQNGLMYPLVLTILFIPFFIVPYAANSIRKEHDQSTWDLLTTTIVTPGQIVAGKLEAALWLFHRRFLVFAIPMLVLGFYLISQNPVKNANYERFSFLLLSCGIVAIYIYMLLAVSFAVYVSARASTTISAYILPLLAAYFMQIIPFFTENTELRKIIPLELVSLVSPIALFDTIVAKSTLWHLCLTTQIVLFTYFCLIFLYLAHRSLRRSMEVD